MVGLEEVSEVVMAFRNDFNNPELNVNEVTYCTGKDRKRENEVYEIHVIVEDVRQNVETTYCYPVANFGRDMGLYLFDTVSLWWEETVKMRFRFEED